MSRATTMTQGEAEEILGLPERYDKATLRAAFTAKAREYHPDNARRNGVSPEVAQREMVKVNQANARLKPFFDANPNQVIHRDLVGGTVGKAGVGVHFDPEGRKAAYTQVDDSLFWDEQGNPRGNVQEDRASIVADAPGHALRRTLLGPVLLRAIFCALFFWLWWQKFPFLPANAAVNGVNDPAASVDWLQVLFDAVYPTYLLVYELFSGTVSGVVREVVNGLVSLASRVHVDVRPKGAYRSALSRLIRNQWYGVLLAPVAVWLFTLARAAEGTQAYVLWALCALVAVDALLAFFGTGIVNSLAERLSDWVEKRYVSARMAMLKRCGQWGGAPSPAGSAAGTSEASQAQASSAPRHAKHARR